MSPCTDCKNKKCPFVGNTEPKKERFHFTNCDPVPDMFIGNTEASTSSFYYRKIYGIHQRQEKEGFQCSSDLDAHPEKLVEIESHFL